MKRYFCSSSSNGVFLSNRPGYCCNTLFLPWLKNIVCIVIRIRRTLTITNWNDTPLDNEMLWLHQQITGMTLPVSPVCCLTTFTNLFPILSAANLICKQYSSTSPLSPLYFLFAAKQSAREANTTKPVKRVPAHRRYIHIISTLNILISIILVWKLSYGFYRTRKRGALLQDSEEEDGWLEQNIILDETLNSSSALKLNRLGIYAYLMIIS